MVGRSEVSTLSLTSTARPWSGPRAPLGGLPVEAVRLRERLGVGRADGVDQRVDVGDPVEELLDGCACGGGGRHGVIVPGGPGRRSPRPGCAGEGGPEHERTAHGLGSLGGSEEEVTRPRSSARQQATHRTATSRSGRGHVRGSASTSRWSTVTARPPAASWLRRRGRTTPRRRAAVAPARRPRPASRRTTRSPAPPAGSEAPGAGRVSTSRPASSEGRDGGRGGGGTEQAPARRGVAPLVAR